MATSGLFSSAAASGKRELVVKNETLSEDEAAAIESGKDCSLFTVTTLNHLRLSGFSGLRQLSPLLGRLENLLQLILEHNALQSLPTEIGSLGKLRLLDLSHNQLQSLPTTLYSLSSLHSLLLGSNCLTDSSFPPPLEPGDGSQLLPNLHHVDLGHNQMTALPLFVLRAPALSELVAPDNAISSLTPAISSLASLKVLDMKRNKVSEVPYELSLCAKLKTLGLEENPLQDKRLLKLVAQHGAKKPRTVLDYVAAHAPKPEGKVPSGKKGKGGRKKAAMSQGVNRREDEENDSDVEFSDARPIVRVQRPEHCVVVHANPDARRVRAYLVCAVIRGLDLERGEMYREFIALQVGKCVIHVNFK